MPAERDVAADRAAIRVFREVRAPQAAPVAEPATARSRRRVALDYSSCGNWLFTVGLPVQFSKYATPLIHSDILL
jgi:hypothetical protein